MVQKLWPGAFQNHYTQEITNRPFPFFSFPICFFFSGVFPFFSKEFWGFREEKTPCFLGGFPWFPKKARVVLTKLVRAARMQNETAPETCLNRYESGLINAKKDTKNDPNRVRKIVKPLSGRLRISHRHFSKILSPPKICTKNMCFFTARLCSGGHAKNWGFYEFFFLSGRKCGFWSRSSQILI